MAKSKPQQASKVPLSETVEEKAERKLKARREKKGVWFGLGLFGIIGWSITVPTLSGIALGVWIDSSYPSRYSWTLMLLVAGLVLGCMNAWHWLQKEGDDD
jgi:ATP synthase protein I